MRIKALIRNFIVFICLVNVPFSHSLSPDKERSQENGFRGFAPKNPSPNRLLRLFGLLVSINLRPRVKIRPLGVVFYGGAPAIVSPKFSLNKRPRRACELVGYRGFLGGTPKPAFLRAFFAWWQRMRNLNTKLNKRKL